MYLSGMQHATYLYIYINYSSIQSFIQVDIMHCHIHPVIIYKYNDRTAVKL